MFSSTPPAGANTAGQPTTVGITGPFDNPYGPVVVTPHGAGYSIGQALVNHLQNVTGNPTAFPNPWHRPPIYPGGNPGGPPVAPPPLPNPLPYGFPYNLIDYYRNQGMPPGAY